MKIEFKNGSVIESIENTDGIRGKGWFVWLEDENEEDCDEEDLQ